MRPWKHPRNARLLYQEQNPHLSRGSRCRDEDMSRSERQNRRCVLFSLLASIESSSPTSKVGQFGVAMNEGHFKDLLFELVPPPAQKVLSRSAGPGSGAATANNLAADLMIMGFPTRLPDTSSPSLCVCHSELKSQGFLCPRCLSKVCDVPTDCDICGLMIVSSPHLARSYHHLFPVKPYEAV